MALSASTIFEVESGGSDTANSGAFDPSQVVGGNPFTDLAAVLANTSVPVLSSNSYTFVVGDIGSWVYVASGTNWIAGWYKITSVASGLATVSAAIGAAVIAKLAPSTAVGCAIVASPTGALWSIDYTQQTTPARSYTDLASTGAGLTVSSAAFPFGKQMTGNSIVVTSGTNFTPGVYVVQVVNGVVATLVGATNITTGAGSAGVGGMGGACASPGYASSKATSTGTSIYVKSATYSITSATANVSTGCVSLAAGLHLTGYQTVRGDGGTKPVLQASGITSATLVASVGACTIDNIEADGASLTDVTPFSTNGFSNITGCRGRNAGSAVSIFFQGNCYDCEATGGTCFAGFQNAYALGCTAHDLTGHGFYSDGGYTVSSCMAVRCLGAANDGFNAAGSFGYASVSHCTAYGCGRHGFNLTVNTNNNSRMRSCLAVGNGGFGFTASAAVTIQSLQKCAAYNNTSGAFNTTNVPVGRSNPDFITLTADPFTNAAGNDFTLNNASGGGALLRALALPTTWPGLSTTGYRDIGAAQHRDPAGGNRAILTGGRL